MSLRPLTCLTLASLLIFAPAACTLNEVSPSPDDEHDQGAALDMRSGDDQAPSTTKDMATSPARDMRVDGDPSKDMPGEPDMGKMSPGEDMRGDAGSFDGSCGGAAGVSLCDDFEGSTIGAQYREVNFGQSAISLDKSRSHSGVQSVKVSANNFTQMLATAVPATKFYGRVYISSDTPMNAGHNTYINAGEGDGDPNNGEWIRIGEHREQLEINRKSDDAELLSSGDYNSLQGATQLLANTWYCLEFLFDGPGKEVRVWVDGQAVTKLHATTWGANYQTFKFGYERYHGPDKTLWYDDLALGTERIGCQ